MSYFNIEMEDFEIEIIRTNKQICSYVMEMAFMSHKINTTIIQSNIYDITAELNVRKLLYNLNVMPRKNNVFLNEIRFGQF